MSRTLSRNLYLAAIGLTIVAIILDIIVATTTNTSYSSQPPTLSPFGSTLFIISIVLYIAASILGLIAWIGALVKMAQLQQWVWFILLLVASGITMLVYIFVGPTTSREMPQMATYPPNPNYPPTPGYTPTQSYPTNTGYSANPQYTANQPYSAHPEYPAGNLPDATQYPPVPPPQPPNRDNPSNPQYPGGSNS